MKKKLIFLLFISPFIAMAQDEETEEPKDGWTKSGNIS